MLKSLLAAACAFLALAGTGTPASASNPDPRTEAKLERDVLNALSYAGELGAGQVQARVVAPGEILLSGKVRTQQDKQAALDAVKGVRGVRALLDHLSVGPRETGESLALKGKIERRLTDDWRLPAASSLTVHTSGNEVVIDGVTENWDQEKIAAHDAFESGASKVVSDVVVRNDPARSRQARTYRRDPLSRRPSGTSVAEKSRR